MQSRSDLELAWLSTDDNGVAGSGEGAEERGNDGDGDASMGDGAAAGGHESASPYSSLPPLHRLAPGSDKSEQKVEGEESAIEGGSEDIDFVTTKTTIIVTLDRFSPATGEAKWLKSGEVDEWLATLSGSSPAAVAAVAATSSASAAAATMQHAWTGKIRVLDPDPPPTMQDVYAEWSSRSFLGSGRDRRRFIQEYLQTSRGQIEILCRLVRGERASSSSSTNASGAASPSLASYATAGAGGAGAGPLAAAARKTSFSSHQTHLSLAVLALFGLAEEYAGKLGEGADGSGGGAVKKEEETKAGSGEASAKAKGKAKARSGSRGREDEDFEKRIDALLMSMPQNLIWRALDGMVSTSTASRRARIFSLTRRISLSLTSAKKSSKRLNERRPKPSESKQRRRWRRARPSRHHGAAASCVRPQPRHRRRCLRRQRRSQPRLRLQPARPRQRPFRTTKASQVLLLLLLLSKLVELVRVARKPRTMSRL